MLNFKGQLELPLAQANCGVAKGNYWPDIHPDEAKTIIPCRRASTNIISCANEERDTYISQVGGLSLDTITAQQSTTAIATPLYIPTIDQGFFGIHSESLQQDTVIVSLEDIFGSLPRTGSCVRVRDWSSLVEDLLQQPIFKDKKVILSLCGPDYIIESLWCDALEIDFYNSIAKMGFYGVIAFNFSLFANDCALGQWLNCKKSLFSFSELQQVGMSAVPHVYWLNQYQLQRWAIWLRQNPQIDLIAINCQCDRTRVDMDLAASGIRYLAEQVGPNLRFLLLGPRTDLLKQLVDLGDRLSISQKYPTMQALNSSKFELSETVIHRVPRSKLPKEFLLYWNHSVYEERLKGILLPPKKIAPATRQINILQPMTSTIRLVRTNSSQLVIGPYGQ